MNDDQGNHRNVTETRRPGPAAIVGMVVLALLGLGLVLPLVLAFFYGLLRPLFG